VACQELVAAFPRNDGRHTAVFQPAKKTTKFCPKDIGIRQPGEKCFAGTRTAADQGRPASRKPSLRDLIEALDARRAFFKNNNLDYADAFAWAGHKAQNYGWILFILVVIFIVTAISNGANMTDGLDGLATGSSAIIGVILGILAYVSGNVNYAGYLNIMYLPGTGELLIFAGAFIGSTIGFLWYNAFPAQVFMGDTGSLTLGGIIAVFAIAIHKELLIPILCGIFIIENLSVMMQVGYFKYTKKRFGEGRRIFKMAPLHHHFQKPGNAGIQAYFQSPLQAMPESKIVIRFWIVGIILAAVTIITLKIR
jgi:phospho-N-acetylmuramoyl-pentapeptide-transferase